MTEREGIEEAREGRGIARQALLEDLLPEVVVHVRAQCLAGGRGVVVGGQEAPVQRPQQVEVRDLGPGQRMQVKTEGATAQEAGISAREFSLAGPAEDETEAVFLHEPANFVEDPRDLLDLVDEDGLAPLLGLEGPDAIRESPGGAGEFQHQPGVEEVEARGSREPPPEQGRFSGTAGAPEESGLAGEQVQAGGSGVGGQGFVVSSEIVGLFWMILRCHSGGKRGPQRHSPTSYQSTARSGMPSASSRVTWRSTNTARVAPTRSNPCRRPSIRTLPE